MIAALLSFSGLKNFKAHSAPRVLGDGIWIAMGQGLAALGSLVGIRLATEVAPPEVFGLVSLLIGISALGTNLFCTPLLTAALRFYPDLKAEDKLPQLRHFLEKRVALTLALLVGITLIGGELHSLVTGF